MAEERRVSALADLIAAGKADPISDEERAIVARIQAKFQQKYGRPPVRPPSKPGS